ncbi:hypothetical protein AeMF1_018592 [Aphanomyces euteiches]|nr:hypothetical protein AeMF1_018592 [Aphanomyces euteiches]
MKPSPSSPNRLRQLSPLDGESSTGIYLLLIIVCAVVVVLYTYGVYQAKQARVAQLERRESTAATTIDLEIATP